MVKSLLAYTYATWRFPEADRIGLLRGGMGIERRSRKFGAAWKGHLERCIAVQKEWISSVRSKPHRIAILGAGRLLDIDLCAYTGHCNEVILVDGDPLAVRHCKRVSRRRDNPKVIARLAEITGILPIWLREVKQHLARVGRSDGDPHRGWSDVLSYIEEITTLPAELAPLEARIGTDFRGGAIVSLNLLSQLPLGWQTGIENLLTAHFGSRWITEHEDEWLRVIQPGGALLVSQHIHDLLQTGAHEVLIVTDVGIREVDDSDFAQRTEALIDPLFGIRLDALLNSSLDLQWRSLGSWTWHIVPMSGERLHRGIFHDVTSVAISLPFGSG